MNDKVLSLIARNSMLSPGDRVIVGVSGGADSMALLHFLWMQREALEIYPIAVHINHGIRGAAADADERYVSEWCRQREIPCFLARCDVPFLAKQYHLGEEECGRKLRYSFFSEVAEKISRGEPLPEVQTWEQLEERKISSKTVRIATAHTLSDTVETVLFHMTRGSGNAGLCGIPPVRGAIIRPLLSVSRREVESYCKENAIDYVTDQTNSDTKYARNRIREQVIPALESINPSFLQAMERLIRQQSEDFAYFSLASETALQIVSEGDRYSCEKILALPEAIRHRVLQKIAESFGAVGAEMRHIYRLAELLQKSGGVNFPGNVTVISDGVHLRRFCPKNQEKHGGERIVFAKDSVGEVNFSGRTIHFLCPEQKKEENSRNVYKLYSNSALDYDIIPTELILRTRQSGDQLRLAPHGVTKSLKKWMNECHIPPEKREHLLVLEGEGEILWVEDLGVSEKAQVGENTRRMFILRPEGEA